MDIDSEADHHGQFHTMVTNAADVGVSTSGDQAMNDYSYGSHHDLNIDIEEDYEEIQVITVDNPRPGTPPNVPGTAFYSPFRNAYTLDTPRTARYKGLPMKFHEDDVPERGRDTLDDDDDEGWTRMMGFWKRQCRDELIPRRDWEYSLFEYMCARMPILRVFLGHLDTVTQFMLMETSKLLRAYVTTAAMEFPSLFADFALVRNKDWHLLVTPYRKRIIDAGPPPSLAVRLPDHHPHSLFFKQYVQFAAYYDSIESVEKRCMHEEQVQWMLERLVDTIQNPAGRETVRLFARQRGQGLVSRARLAALSYEEFSQMFELQLARHRYHAGDVRGAYAGVVVDNNEAFVNAPPFELAFFQKFCGSQFIRMLYMLPHRTRYVTKLTIDGTAITNLELYPVLKTLETSLEYVSARECKQITTAVFCDWLEGALHDKRPFALRELKVFGCSDFRAPYEASFTKIPPEKFFAGGYPEGIKVPYFAEVIPLDVIKLKTLPDLLPQQLDYVQKATAYTIIGTQTQSDYDVWDAISEEMRSRNRKMPAFAGGNAIWGIPTAIRLMTVCHFIRAKLDLAHCASGRYCWSYNTKKYLEAPRDYSAYPIIDEELIQQLNFTREEYQEIMDMWNEVFPYVPSRWGARREEGGKVCSNCGIWETENAEPVKGFNYNPNPLDYISPLFNNAIRDALLNTGSICYDTRIIGQGRFRGRGEYCVDCVINQTCRLCDEFYCTNCLYTSEAYETHPNPHCKEEPSPDFITHHCTRHSPICAKCLPKAFLFCTHCKTPLCKQCYPSGITLIPHQFNLASAMQAHINNPDASAYRTPAYGIPPNKLPQPSMFPAYEAIRTDAALRGLHEERIYAKCDVCKAVSCRACLSTSGTVNGIERFTLPCGDCQKQICEFCVVRRCDSCDRILCEDCTGKEIESIVTIHAALKNATGESILPKPPKGKNAVGVELCLHCLLFKKYRVHEANGTVPRSALFFDEAEKERLERLAKANHEGFEVDPIDGEVVAGGEPGLIRLDMKIQEIVDRAVIRALKKIGENEQEETDYNSMVNAMGGINVDAEKAEAAEAADQAEITSAEPVAVTAQHLDDDTNTNDQAGELPASAADDSDLDLPDLGPDVGNYNDGQKLQTDAVGVADSSFIADSSFFVDSSFMAADNSQFSQGADTTNSGAAEDTKNTDVGTGQQQIHVEDSNEDEDMVEFEDVLPPELRA